MAGGMPVLRQHDVAKPRGEAIDDRHDLIAARHRERAARTEIVLHVHDDEDVSAVDRRAFLHCGAFSDCSRRSTSAASSFEFLGDLDRIGRARLEPAQGFGQPLELARRAASDLVERWRRPLRAGRFA